MSGFLSNNYLTEQFMMTTFRIKTLIIIAVSLVFLTGATSYNGYRNFPKTQPTTEGQLIYEEMGCVMCHGPQGFGDGFLAEGLNPKPRNFSSYEEMNRIPYQSMYSAIKKGIPYSGMPAHDLSDEQIDEVIAYIKTFLTENYLTINTCVDTPQIVSLDNIETGGTFNIEIDKENFVSTLNKAGELKLTPNFKTLLKTYRKKQSRLVRVHVNLTKGKGKKKRYLAIIALRIKNCLK